MDQDAALLRAMVRWSAHYEPAWDAQPARYLDEGIVQWGRSRRLGRLQRGDLKAYIGIQHVDPTKSGWGIVEEPQARFFVSLFVSGKTVTLRTFPTMHLALNALSELISAIE